MERLNRPCHGTVHLPCELREVVADHGPVGDDHGERGIARFRIRIDVPLQILDQARALPGVRIEVAAHKLPSRSNTAPTALSTT